MKLCRLNIKILYLFRQICFADFEYSHHLYLALCVCACVCVSVCVCVYPFA